MKKQILIILLVSIIVLIVLTGLALLNSNRMSNYYDRINKISKTVESNGEYFEEIESDSEFSIYKFNNDKLKNEQSNMIILKIDYDADSTNNVIIEEYEVKPGDKVEEIEVLDIAEEYMNISLDGMAPRVKNRGISLTKKYDDFKINKNTGVYITKQVTDYFGGKYVFFVSK